MKPVWKTVWKVLKVIGKVIVWLSGSDGPLNEKKPKA